MIYLRREPTTDEVALKNCQPKDLAKMLDVVFYSYVTVKNGVQEPGGVLARHPWFYSGRPRRGCRTVVLNCHRHDCEWLPDLRS